MRKGVCGGIPAATTDEGWFAEPAQIDSSYVKAHRCSGGAKKVARAQAIDISRDGKPKLVNAMLDNSGLTRP